MPGRGSYETLANLGIDLTGLADGDTLVWDAAAKVFKTDPPSSGTSLTATQAGTIAAPTPKTMLAFQPIDPLDPPFQLHFAGASFNGTWDPVMYAGWNADRAIGTEPVLTWNIEARYEPSEGTFWQECYWEYLAPNRTIGRRPVGFVVDRATHDVTTHLLGKDISFTDQNSVEYFSINTGSSVMRKYYNIHDLGAGARTVLSVLNLAGTGSAKALSIDASNRLLFGETIANIAGIAFAHTAQFLDAGGTFPAAGAGINVHYNAGVNKGFLQVYDFTGAAWKALDIKASAVAIYGSGTERFRADATGIGFYGNAGVAKQTLAAAATDLASAITLANDIRTKLINLGLAS